MNSEEKVDLGVDRREKSRQQIFVSRLRIAQSDSTRLQGNRSNVDSVFKRGGGYGCPRLGNSSYIFGHGG
jgi:hypothetical protein